MPVTINGSAGVTTNSGAVYDGIQRGTAITLTNQTAVEFTSIPSWVKRITVMLSGVSTNGTGQIVVQLGTSSGYTTSGYLSGVDTTVAGVAAEVITNGFAFLRSATSSAANILQGQAIITSLGANTWVSSQLTARTNTAGIGIGAGSIALSGSLDRIRLYIDGTQFFDAGTINILYE